MKNYSLGQKILGAIIGLFALFGIYQSTPLGNVSETQSMSATTTLSSWSGTYRQLKTSAGILGSVLLASTTPTQAATAIMTFKDATSTTDISSSTIAVVGSNTATGNFPYNIAFSRGLIVEVGVGHAGGYTITSK